MCANRKVDACATVWGFFYMFTRFWFPLLMHNLFFLFIFNSCGTTIIPMAQPEGFFANELGRFVCVVNAVEGG